MKKKRNKPGRKARRLKAEGLDWKDGMRHAMTKPKPEDWDKAKDADKDEAGKDD